MGRFIIEDDHEQWLGPRSPYTPPITTEQLKQRRHQSKPKPDPNEALQKLFKTIQEVKKKVEDTNGC